MAARVLTITLRPGLREFVRGAVQTGQATEYQGERLNFEAPEDFFGELSACRWQIVNTLQMAGAPLSFRELARQLQRDVKRIHGDVVHLEELGLVERTSRGVVCPYQDIHIDMHLHRQE